jgi:glutaredoxin-like protein
MFLQPHDRTQLAEFFAERMVQPVELVLFGQRGPDCHDPHPYQDELCGDAWALLQELAQLSPLLATQRLDWRQHPHQARQLGVDKVPAIALRSPQGLDPGIRFFGVPTHFEFITLIETIVNFSSGDLELSDTTLAALQHLQRDIHLQVFHTMNCPMCPLMTHLCCLLALASPRVRCDSIGAAEFPSLARHYGVRAAPHIVVNETTHIIGFQNERDLIAALGRAALWPCPVRP